MLLFTDLDMLSLVRISRLNWIGHVNGMHSEGEVSQVFGNNRQGSRLQVGPKIDCGIVYKPVLINAELKTGKTGRKIELIGRNPLRKWKVRIGL
jgi:hypothetical protein